MKTNLLRTLLLLLLSISFLTSCDNDEDEVDPEPTKTDILTAHEWKGDQVLVDNMNVENIPGLGDGAATFKTLRLNFEEDNTYTATFTADNQQQNLNGTWQFNADETKITVENLGELNVNMLTESNFNVAGSLSSESVDFIAQLMGINPLLIRAFTGGGAVDTELRFVK